VIVYDDFTQDELGEFPARWDLKQGTYEVAEGEGERWLRCVSPDATIRMKLPAMASLPEFWTLEFDFFGTESHNNIAVKGLGPEREAWEVTFFNGPSVTFRSGEIFSSTPIEGVVPGHHHLMFMARGKALKVYLDRQRVVNVPDMSAEAGMPNMLAFRMFSPNQPMISNVRFAEGCRPAKDMLAEGKLVTHGIRFATGSDVVLPESAPVLRQVAAYMEANPAVRLQVTGHTDNVGTAASNLDLSKRRAASVAKVLGEQFAVTADRFATDGKGDTQPMAPNAKPEGRAMNRRVEFAKM
jgi:outer membrane protein OmpA-like peptidoglycan-associated protein